jgi:hypothetical protein
MPWKNAQTVFHACINKAPRWPRINNLAQAIGGRNALSVLGEAPLIRELSRLRRGPTLGWLASSGHRQVFCTWGTSVDAAPS